MTPTFTADQIRRIRQSLSETHKLLAKELSYPVHLPHRDRVSFYQGHIVKLTGMLSLACAA